LIDTFLFFPAPAELIPGEEVVDEILIGGDYHFKTKVPAEEGATVMVGSRT
jgi:hypothetical protein